MIVRPKVGQLVQVWYRKELADFMPYHGQIAHVLRISRGPGPRNHEVSIDGAIVVVPCGNIRRIQF